MLTAIRRWFTARRAVKSTEVPDSKAQQPRGLRHL
jgi:hypothetical protein